MNCKNKNSFKVASILLIGAFSFGLSISCVNAHNKDNIEVSAEESDGTWTLSNGSLSFQYTDWQTNGYVEQTNQIMVYGRGDGTFDIGYELLGSPPGATTAGTEKLDEKTIQLTDGYWTPSETGGYGTVSGKPVNVNGLDSGVMITLDIVVQPSGTMNEQGSGEGDDENAGTWTWNADNMTLSFQFSDTATAGYVSTTSQTMVYGHGNGTFDIGYDLYGTPAGATMASNDLLASKTITLYDGYFNEDTATVTGNSSEVDGLESYGQITVNVDVTPSGDLSTNGWRVNDGDLYFYILADEYAATIDSITWNNSSGNGTGEAILSVTISTGGGSSQQAYQINNPSFDPELEGTSGTTSGNTTVEGISEWSDRPVTLDVSYKSYSLGESTQESGWSYTEGLLTYFSGEFGQTTFEYHTEAGGSQVPYCIGNLAVFETFDGQVQATISFSFYNESDEEVPVENATLVLTDADYNDVSQNVYCVTGNCEDLTNEPLTIYVQSVETSGAVDPTTDQYRYTIMFDGNGATGGSMSTVEFYSDNTSVDYELPECSFEKEDYAFFAWSPSEDGLITIKPHQTRNITYSEDGETFFAIWGRTIRFESNGGDGYMEPLVVKEGYNEVPSCDFTRDGYAFKCWAVGSTGDEVNAGSRVYVNANYVLYAVWQPNNAAIEIEEDEVVVYVGEDYLMQYKILPEGYETSIYATVEQERVADVYVEGEIFIYGLSAGTTKVTLSDESGSLTKTFTLYVVEPPVPIEPENKVDEETINGIKDGLDEVGLTTDQANQIKATIDSYVNDEGRNYISQSAGDAIKDAISQTKVTTTDEKVAEGQQALIVAVVETGLTVEAGKATSLSDAQEIDKALPEDAHFSVEGEIAEFYQRQMIELFGGEMPTRRITRAGDISRDKGIDIDPKGKSGDEGKEYLLGEKVKYEKMVDFVDSSVDHMGKAALKLRKCSGESVVVQVKSYVTVVKVSSFRDFDKEAADKEFVEAAYKAILLSMQNEVISILEKEHEPSNNAEKEAQYQKELDAVKDYETFEIMVTEVLRQKYNTIAKEPIDDVDEFKPIYWEIFEAWALDKQSKHGITLEELTKATIEQSTNRARTFTVHSDLSTNEWIFIGAIAGGAALIITAAAVIPTLLKKKKAKEGIN